MRRWANKDAFATLGLCVFALLWTVYFQAHSSVNNPIRADASQYVAIALNLLERHIYSMSDPTAIQAVPDSYRPPGYPWFLAATLVPSGGQLSLAWYQAVRDIQALMSAAIVGMTFRIGREYLSFTLAFFAALLLSIWPAAVIGSGYLLSETFFAFALTTALWFQCAMVRHSFWVWLFLSALFYAIAALINPITLPIIVGVVWLMCRSYGWRSPKVIVFLVISVLPTLTWQICNESLPDASGNESHRLVQNVVMGMEPELRLHYLDHSSSSVIAARHRYESLVDLFDRDHKAFYAAIYRRLASEPLHYLSWYLQKTLQVWDWQEVQGHNGLYIYPLNSSSYDNNLLYRFSAGLAIVVGSIALVFVPFGILSIFKIKRRAVDRVPLQTMGLIFLYVSILYTLLTPDSRYATPFRGIEFVLAMLGGVWVTSWIRLNKRREHGR